MPFSLSGFVSGVINTAQSAAKSDINTVAKVVSDVTHPSNIENSIVQVARNAENSVATALSGSASAAMANISQHLSTQKTPSARVAAALTSSMPIKPAPPSPSVHGVTQSGIPNSIGSPNNPLSFASPLTNYAQSVQSNLSNASFDGTSAQSTLGSVATGSSLSPQTVSTTNLAGLVSSALQNPVVAGAVGVAAGAGLTALGSNLLTSHKKKTTHHRAKHHRKTTHHRAKHHKKG